MVVMTPSDENECRQMLFTGYQCNQPAAVRYPRGSGCGSEIMSEMQALELGKGRIVRQGKGTAMLAFGTLLHQARAAAEALDATLVDMRFVKPMDEALVLSLAASHDQFVTLEDNAIMGGAGSAVNELLMRAKQCKPVLNLGLPDRFVEQGTQEEIYAQLGLDATGIQASIEAWLQA
ncbi:1-deoxy-D-xylulose-5-phosphate synthase [compost metagenome]